MLSPSAHHVLSPEHAPSGQRIKTTLPATNSMTIKIKFYASIIATLLATSANAQEVANSQVNFSLTQGKNGWTYGWIKAPAEYYCPCSFTKLISDGTKWVTGANSTYWTQISRDGTHPNGKVTTAPSLPAVQSTVRRWKSSVAGTYQISGYFNHVGANGYDGISARIYTNATAPEIYYPQILGTQVNFSFQLTLAAGQYVDFIVGAGEATNDIQDATLFSAVITKIN